MPGWGYRYCIGHKRVRGMYVAHLSEVLSDDPAVDRLSSAARDGNNGGERDRIRVCIQRTCDAVAALAADVHSARVATASQFRERWTSWAE